MIKRIILIIISFSLFLLHSTPINKDEDNAFSFFSHTLNSLSLLTGINKPLKYDNTYNIRGSLAKEEGVYFDNFLIRNHSIVNGYLSIFNNNVFSSELLYFVPSSYNNALSGIILIDNHRRNKSNFYFSQDIYSFNLGGEIYLSEIKTHFILDYRISYFSLELMLLDALKVSVLPINIKPFYNDLFFAVESSPHPNFSFDIKSYFNMEYGKTKDQISQINETELTNKLNVKYQNTLFFCFTNLKFKINEILSIKLFSGYELFYSLYDYSSIINGKKYYSEEFKSFFEKITSLPLVNDYYSINNLGINSKTEESLNSNQSKIIFDTKINETVKIETGFGFLFDYKQRVSQSKYPGYNMKEFDLQWWGKINLPVYKEENAYSYDKYYLYNVYHYGNINFNFFENSFIMDLYFKLEQNTITNPDKRLFTYPSFQPGINIKYYFIKKCDIPKNIYLSCFLNLVTQVNDNNNSITNYLNKYRDNEIIPQYKKLLSTGIDLVIDFPLNFTLITSLFYKRYFDNVFFVNNEIKSDGVGQITGTSIEIKRELSKYVYGTINYTFIDTSFFYPYNSDARTSEGYKTNTPVTPNHHRYHQFNTSITIKPLDFLSITTNFSIISGVNKKSLTGKSVAGILEKEYKWWELINQRMNLIELWSSSTDYINNEKSGLLFPLDVKVNFYFKVSKVHFEISIGADNILATLYSQLTIKDYSVDMWTGKESGATEKSLTNTPLPYILFKISY